MTAAQPTSLPYRSCVGIVLINRDRLVFAGRRLSTMLSDAWQMPQGGIDAGEKPEHAALRELHEEVGTDQGVIVDQIDDWLTYDLPPDLLGRALRGRYRGQKQKWFAVEFTGEDGDIRIDTDEPEFDEWRWMKADDLLAIIVDFKRPVYERVFAQFRHLVA